MCRLACVSIEALTSLCSSWHFLACLVERSSATWVNLMLSAFCRYLVYKMGKWSFLLFFIIV